MLAIRCSNRPRVLVIGSGAAAEVLFALQPARARAVGPLEEDTKVSPSTSGLAYGP